MNIEYLEREVAANTRYKSVSDAYQRNYIAIVKRDNVFWIESSGCPDKAYKLAIKETKRLFPNLVYLYEL